MARSTIGISSSVGVGVQFGFQCSASTSMCGRPMIRPIARPSVV
jgi:hypothetical protein